MQASSRFGRDFKKKTDEGVKKEITEPLNKEKLKSPAREVHVELKAMAIQPKHIKIKVGQTVVWTNKDNVIHSINSGTGTDPDKNPLLNSGMMGPKVVFKFTFKKPGKYTYLCLPHAYQEPMRDATVTVGK